MRDVLYIAWRYVAYHRARSLTLVLAITIVAFLPIALHQLVDESERQLLARAESTPLVLGARGSSLDLVMNALYFSAPASGGITQADADAIDETGLAESIPLHVRFAARGQPIVGTTLEYFDFRGLEVADGEGLAILGDCVVGSLAAEALDVGPGDALVSSPETAFDMAGSYPLRMQVRGVLSPTHSPDDAAVFVDVRTAWVIAGLGHGHQDLGDPNLAGGLTLRRDAASVTANAALVQYNEITAENVDSFHFHGDAATYPLSAALAIPRSERARVLLLGRYLERDEPHVLVEPNDAIEELMARIFKLEGFTSAVLAVASVATLLTILLVFSLSLRLRESELKTMHKLGCGRAMVTQLVVAELLILLTGSAALTLLFTLASLGYQEAFLRWMTG